MDIPTYNAAFGMRVLSAERNDLPINNRQKDRLIVQLHSKGRFGPQRINGTDDVPRLCFRCLLPQPTGKQQREQNHAQPPAPTAAYAPLHSVASSTLNMFPKAEANDRVERV